MLSSRHTCGPSVDRQTLSGRRALGFLIRLLIFAVIFAGVGEVWFRTVTPAGERPRTVLDPASLVMTFDPQGPRQGLFTVGRLGERAARWTVNDDGWISSFEYAPASSRDRPLIVTMGDSYVEGFFTPPAQHVDVYMRQALQGSCDVYTLAQSGWSLEECVAAARYATTKYRPDVLVVFVNAGDIAESLVGGETANFWRIARDAAGNFTEVPPAPLAVMSRQARLARESAIFRYIRYDAKVASAEVASGAETSASVGSGDLLSAADYMVAKLCADHPGTPIVFASHEESYLTPNPASRATLFADAAAVRAACGGRPQCHFLDLQAAFARDQQATALDLKAVDGHHWSAHANEVVARAVADFIEENGLLAPSQS